MIKRLLFFLLFPTFVLCQEEGYEDFTRRDRTAILYSTKLLFTSDNVPIIRVGIMDGQENIKFSSDNPFMFLSEGEGGSSLKLGQGHTECTASIRTSKPAKIRYWIVLAKVRAQDLEKVRNIRQMIEKEGKKVRLFERGSVFGFYGKIMDNRMIFIVEDNPYNTIDDALKRKKEMKNENELDIFEEIMNRPSGVIRIVCNGVKAELEYPGMVNITTDGMFKVHDVEFGKGFSWHGREDRTYRGQLIIAIDRNGLLSAINLISTELFLKGLVPSEMYVDAPFEALKAQAVCARAELYAKLGTRHFADPYMVCSDVHCQVYRGSGRENPRTDKAVEETRGEVPFYEGQLLDAVYSASCGGHTEDGSNVWKGVSHPYLKGVLDRGEEVEALNGGKKNGGDKQKDFQISENNVHEFLRNPPKGLYCNNSRFGKGSFRWEKECTPSEIAKNIKTLLNMDVGEVNDLTVKSRGVSGRVTGIEVKGSVKTVFISPELTIRKVLCGLKSSLFVFERNKQGFRFIGGGFGHGVGMCQIGAIGMAEQGKTYKEILQHYFQKSEIVKIY